MSNPSIEAENAFALAEDLIRDRFYEKATQLLLDTIAKYPDYGKAYAYLGWLYQNKYSDLAQAEAYFKAALQHSPFYRATYYNYAMLLSVSQRYAELEALLKQAETVPGINLGSIYNEYALMYEAQGDYDKAIYFYREYAKLCYDNQQLKAALEGIERSKQKKALFGDEAAD